MSKDNDENAEEDQVKVHEIKFDEFGIMDDGLEESTADQLKNLGEGDDEAEGATAIDEDLFEDEDLEELEEDMQNLDVWDEYEMMILNNTTPIKTFIHPEKKNRETWKFISILLKSECI